VQLIFAVGLEHIQLIFTLLHHTLPLQVFPDPLFFCINRNNMGASPAQLDNHMFDHLKNFGPELRQHFGE
jgi:hypothetical protein